MSSPPIVSIVVPSFNEKAEIVRASLDSLKVQTFTDFECIVIDESTLQDRADACAACCAGDARFIYVHPKQRLGLAASLNLGIDKARGEFIARFDADDLCAPDRLALQVKFLKEHPQLSLVGGALEIIDEEGKSTAIRDYPLSHIDIAKGIHFTSTVAHPTAMFRRSVALAHGAYDPDFRFSEDLELWLRWMRAGIRFANLPQILVRYRQNETRRNTQVWRYNLKARIRNFATEHMVRRIVGICGIGIWMALPAAVQERAFKALVFRRAPKRASAS
jgi:glycosyltransferase involved in cell wall biosynthesis